MMKYRPNSVLDLADYLVRLEAARHAILIDVTAAIGQAAFTNVLSGAGSVDVTAAINKQVLPLTDITCENRHKDKHILITTLKTTKQRDGVAISSSPLRPDDLITHPVHL